MGVGVDSDRRSTDTRGDGRKENNLKGFKDLYRKVKARIWP